MPAYVPPALRGVAGQQTEGQPRLGERIWRVTLEYSSGGPFDAAECPETLSDTAHSDQSPDVTVRHFEMPSDASTNELKDLLSWFRKASAASSEQHPQGDARCQLLFPPSLSKDARKMIHQLAQTLRLPTFSKGLGEERRLMVHGVAFRDTPEMEAEVAAVAARRRAPANIRERARQMWKWCQADGGSLWSLSLGELEESLLAAPDGSALPLGVKDLLERREHGTALIAAIQAGDTAAALAVLEAHPRAAWIKDDGPGTAPAAGPSSAGPSSAATSAGGAAGPGSVASSSAGGAAGGGAAGAGAGADGSPGYYPLHLAALAGLGDVVEKIASQPGAVEQRDRNYATPLKVAKKAGQMAMVDILLRHGAKDYEINQAAHKTSAMGIPTPLPPAGGARRISSSHGGSPHVGSPATASSPHTPHSLGSSYMAAHVAARQRRISSDAGAATRGPHPNAHQQHQQHGHGHHHGPSSLGPGQQHRGSGHGGSAGGGGRRSLDENHPVPPSASQHHPHPVGGITAAVAASNDPTLNPFAVLAASGERSGGSSRRSSAGGLPPRPPTADGAGAGGGASDSDSSTGGAGGGGGSLGYGNRGAGRARAGGTNRCALPPIQSGEVSEVSVMAALAAMGLSAKPGLPTAAEAPEEASGGGAAGGAAGSDDDDDDAAEGGGAAGAAGDDGGPKKRKTRRGRRGRGSRRQSQATPDDAMAAGLAAAAAAAAAAGSEVGNVGGGAVAAGTDPISVPHSLLYHRTAGPASVGAGSSDHSALTDGTESDGSAGGSKTRRGGQPARVRRHERRRAARVSGADGADRPAGAGRRSSGAEYASFHQGHGAAGGGVGSYGHGARGSSHGGATGGHYHVYGGALHGHADDASSWRRDPAAEPVPAAAAAAAGLSPSPLRGGPDEPRAPASAGGRPPAPRRTSAGPGVAATPGSVGGFTSGGGAPPEAPGSPFHHGLSHGPREHVAAGPVAGVGFGFGRGRGRGLAPFAPGSGVPSAPGSPLRLAATSNGPPAPPPPPPPPPPVSTAAATASGAGGAP